MSLKKLSEEAAAAMMQLIPGELTEEQRREMARILDHALVKSVEEATRSHREATVICCGPEADLAHKISEEMDRASTALVANLQALR